MDKEQQKSIFIGFSSGVVRVAITHPIWSMKVRAQQGLPLTLNPRTLYQGVGLSAAMYPLTVITQIELNKALNKHFSPDPSAAQQIGSAFLAGVGASFINCPIEYMVIQQGLTKKSFQKTTAEVFCKYGLRALFTGLAANALRDGSFGTFFLLAPRFLEPYIKPYIQQEEVKSCLAGMISGAGAAACSQPFDTVKTIQQSLPEARSAVKAIQHIYTNHGPLGFFKGGVERGAMVMTSISVLNTTRNKLERMLSDGP